MFEPHVLLHKVSVQLGPVQLDLEQFEVQLVGHSEVLLVLFEEFDGVVEQFWVTHVVPVQFLIVQFVTLHAADWIQELHSVFVQFKPVQFVLLQLAVQFVFVVTQLVPVQFLIEQLEY
jgi:hypothetical protein